MDFSGFLDYLDFLDDADETIAYAQAGGFPQTSRVGFLRRAHRSHDLLALSMLQSSQKVPKHLESHDPSVNKVSLVRANEN